MVVVPIAVDVAVGAIPGASFARLIVESGALLKLVCHDPVKTLPQEW